MAAEAMIEVVIENEATLYFIRDAVVLCGCATHPIRAPITRNKVESESPELRGFRCYTTCRNINTLK